MSLLSLLPGVNAISAVERIGGLIDKFHADSEQAQAVKATLAEHADEVNASLDAKLLSSGKWYEVAPVVAWEWLRNAALLVTIIDLARGKDSGLLSTFASFL